MKNTIRSILFLITCVFALTAYASAAEQPLKVGLYYGSNALASANLQNAVGNGYLLGWFDETTREFSAVGSLTEQKLTMTVNSGYHVQIEEAFVTFEEAKTVADQFSTGFVAYVNNVYRVRVNTFGTYAEAASAAGTYTTYIWRDILGGEHPFLGTVSSPSATVVAVTQTTTGKLLFEFDCSGAKSLGILPNGGAADTLTWFKGYKWYGGFEYRRSTGGKINVINVVSIDDYIKGVLPYEMNPAWPLEALKAQAVCARTYALMQTKHYKSYKFDVCNTTECQVYYGANSASALTDQAAEETSGLVMTYAGELIEAYYYSSNGGASESSGNVWLNDLPYLVGKEDPYEALISIPSYTYTTTYTFSQLTKLLQGKGYAIGTVNGAYVSATTPTGNVAELTFTDTTGKTLCISKEKCRTVLSTKSMRFTILGGGGDQYYVNSAASSVANISGLYTISGNGTVSSYGTGETYVITSSGTTRLAPQKAAAGDSITIIGTGSGHNVGMSQYGAKAMAEQGYPFTDILSFYFTGINLERVG